ncbi:hypothetical protein PILCRDRAFT_126844 [Piloderma croceum F 1598]|uniref:Uncharacterized protein n=1 Tax=Piloderma croceum (strain F 1598) TaxID=765440 RepID=A0A0C3BXQ9_PILCF|nr:hypothetical protein PILCRDRAFT_126844 [Piloderma croceum F 1598]
MSVEQSDIWMAGDGPQTPQSESDSDSDHSVEKQYPPKVGESSVPRPPIPSVGPKVPLDKVYLMGTQAAIFYKDLSRTPLPSEINCLDEATRIALAVQVEERNCLQVEINLAARRCRYHTFSSHHQQLKVERLKEQLNKVSKEVDAAIADAVNKHKTLHPGHSTNVQNPNASGGPVLTQGVPGQPTATIPQPNMQYRPSSTFPVPAHLQASQAANGPQMP